MSHYVLSANTDVSVATSLPTEWINEATIAINPTDPANLIAASKKFVDSTLYGRRTWVAYSKDGGANWVPTTLFPNQGDLSENRIINPVAGFGVDGAAYLLVVDKGSMRIFRSTDGGVTWQQAHQSIVLPVHHSDMASPIPWMGCDPTHRGRLHVIYGGLFQLTIASSEDHGRTWTTTLLMRGGAVTTGSMAPEVCIAPDGTIHVVAVEFSGHIMHWRSADGGKNYIGQRVTGPLSLWYARPAHYSGAFPGGQRRVSGCAMRDGRFVVAWSDVRTGESRIYYRATDESGSKWLGPDAGTPILVSDSAADETHELQPRLSVTEDNVLGCAFYELRPADSTSRANIVLAASLDLETGFTERITISDRAWDPVPRDPIVPTEDVTFGNYFGLTADSASFVVLWPDTRDGSQTLYLDRVKVEATVAPPILPHSEDKTIYRSSESWIVVKIRNGGIIDIIRFPPRGPAGLLIRALRWFGLGRRLRGRDALRAVGEVRGMEVAEGVAHHRG